MEASENQLEGELRVIKEGILYVTPSKNAKLSKIYLSESKASWITIEWLSEELLVDATANYQALFDIHPPQKGKIVMYNDDECVSPRWHRSYLYQTKREPASKTSYMYSGIEPFEDLSLPAPFQKFLNFLNEQEVEQQYNQVIANWYANGLDYIAQHSDCQKGMTENAPIAIITLCENEKLPRELKITPKSLGNLKNDSLYSQVRIMLQHGTIITMYGDTQKKFRHGIPKALNNLSSRVSLTFRKFPKNIKDDKGI